MSNSIENQEERHQMSPAVLFLMGLGIGVVGTVIVIAANEEKFSRTVRQTKQRAAEMGEQVKSRYEETLNNTRHRAADVAEKVEHGAHRLKDKLNE